MDALGGSVLQMERAWWKDPAAKQEHVRRTLGISMARYYQVRLKLLDDPEALAADPVLVMRLRRQRDARSATVRA